MTENHEITLPLPPGVSPDDVEAIEVKFQLRPDIEEIEITAGIDDGDEDFDGWWWSCSGTLFNRTC